MVCHIYDIRHGGVAGRMAYKNLSVMSDFSQMMYAAAR